MTIRALVGLLALVCLVTTVGWCVLRALRPALTYRDLPRLAGLAYMLGFSCLGVIWTLMALAAIPFQLWSILVSSAVIAVVATAVARRRAPGTDEDRPRPASDVLAVAMPAVAIAFLGLLAEGLFRAARLKALTDYDAWAFWVAKAKVVYFTGGLDEQFFTQLVNAQYPPLIPIFDAAAFHAMGSADVVTLHVMSLVLAVAFVWAVAGLLAARTPAWLLWPFLTLLAVTPRVETRVLVPEADLPLQYLIALAVVLIALWLDERKDWQLAAATVFLMGAVLTKREGLVLAAIVIAGTVIASYGRLRKGFPQLATAVGLVALAAIPWRLWYASKGIDSGTPPLGSFDATRARASLRLSYDALFEHGWGQAPALGILAVLVAAAFGARRLAAFQGVVLGGCFLAGALGTYAYRELELSLNMAANPILRVTGVVVITAVAMAPLLLGTVWRKHRPTRELDFPGRPLPRSGAAALVAGILLLYPAALLAGGAPAFPSQSDCVRVARSDEDGELELVFGRFDSPDEAQEFRDKVVGTGFVGTEVRPDGCARWKVTNDGIDSFAAGQATGEEARRAGFDPRLEIDVP